MAALNYVTQFASKILEMYDHDLTSSALFNSNLDIQIRGAKTIKLPKVTVSGYKDHNRATLGFNTGTYGNEIKLYLLLIFKQDLNVDRQCLK